MSGPVGALHRVSFELGLLVVGASKHLQEFVNQAAVALLGFVDCELGEVVAEYVVGIRLIHDRNSLRRGDVPMLP